MSKKIEGPRTTFKRRARALDKRPEHKTMLAKMCNIIMGAREKEYRPFKVDIGEENTHYFLSQPLALFAKIALDSKGYVVLQFGKSPTEIMYFNNFKHYHYLSLEDPAVFRQLKFLINNTY
jgi:hypothetical protein